MHPLAAGVAVALPLLGAAPLPESRKVVTPVGGLRMLTEADQNSGEEAQLPGAGSGPVVSSSGAIALSIMASVSLCCITVGFEALRGPERREAPPLPKPEITVLPPNPQTYAALGGDVPADRLSPRIFGEFVLSLATPWACLACGLAIGWLAGRVALDVALLVFAILFVLRGKGVEAALLNGHGTLDGGDAVTPHGLLAQEVGGLTSCQSPVFTLSALQMIDSITDACACAVAFMQTQETQQRFAKAWSTGSARSLLGPVAVKLGPGGMLVAALAFATWTQTTCGMFAFGDDLSEQLTSRPALQCDLMGMGKLSQCLIKNPKILVRLTPIAGRLIGENICQMVLQTSVIMADGRSLFAQPDLFGSVLLSLGLAGLKSIELASFCCRVARGQSVDGDLKNPVLFGLGLFCLVVVPLWGGLAYVCAKLYFIEACPSHEWGLTTGCVDMLK